ncbi:DUF551 domain-containing protein [Klebsiella pneumoniae]|nr:DUF551 domain-containing protein [Klebsiella pneumoniae]MCQ0724238.1 DUF551 domain-containing protein [Klebsiella pneumoniae]
MTKSTITREQLLEIIETDHVQCGEASYLASMALAAMDSEPVALQPELAKVIYHFRDWNEGFPVERFKADYVISWMLANYPPAPPAPVVSADLLHTAASAIEDLLTTKDRTGAGVWFDLPFRLRSAANAQPAPVVPEEKPIPNTLSMYAVDAVAAIAEVKGWNACRAAMLAAAPQSTGSEPATVPGKWIPVSERVPTKQDGSVFLTWNGQYIGKELFLMGSFQCLKPEIITHWMPLPAAPQEVK